LRRAQVEPHAGRLVNRWNWKKCRVVRKSVMHWLCALFLATSALTIASPAEEIRSAIPAGSWGDAFPITNSTLGAMVFTGTTSDRLLLYLTEPARKASPQQDFVSKSPAAAVVAAARQAGQEQRFSWLSPTVPPPPHLADVWVDWLDRDQPATEFSRTLDPEDGVVVTRFTRGSSGFTERVFVSEADDLTVIHLRTDKVGSLNFKIRLTRPPGVPSGEAAVENRRILTLRGKVSEATDSPDFEIRAWLFPMESEVTPGEKDISILGEGEALVLVATASGPSGSPSLAQIGSRLEKYGFSGTEHPDISLLWEGLLERHLKAHRALMAEKK
jgi:hypothetical protein